jgi:hypothetical protein
LARFYSYISVLAPIPVSVSTAEPVGNGSFDRRVAPADVLDAIQNLAIAEEPEEPRTFAEEHDRAVLDDDDDDDDLLRWAQRSALQDGELLPPSCPTCSPD